MPLQTDSRYAIDAASARSRDTAGQPHRAGHGDLLYIEAEAVAGAGAGCVDITSAPAHRPCPTRHPTLHDARRGALGSTQTANRRLLPLMSQPAETRHLVIANEEAILSPPWSIHCGAGWASFASCRAMAGDNPDFTDKDMISMDTLR